MENEFLQNFYQPFFLERKGSHDNILLCQGDIHLLDKISQIPLPLSNTLPNQFVSINLIPFCQAKERGFDVHDGNEKIKSLTVQQHHYIPLQNFMTHVENCTVNIENISYDISFEDYQNIIRQIIEDEIGDGQGANFVIPREFTAQILGDLLPCILSIFRSLLVNEIGAYSTFLLFDGTDYTIGASPERHISKIKGEVMMNPISGTFRKNETDAAHFQEDFFAFLQDRKEVFELFMVMDEELKIMCELCNQGGAIIGPLLKEMSKLLHTEYLLIGHSDKDIHHLLKYSMFAPTVTGSPVKNAFRVNKKYEKQSRGYYSSVIAVIGTDDEGGEMLDAPITIRTLEISGDGKISGRAGATLVRGSDPLSEAKETEVKISGVINSIKLAGTNPPAPQAMLPLINAEQLQVILQKRNINLSRFWVEPQNKEYCTQPEFIGKKMVIVDGEDGFSNMLKRMINHLGADIEWRHYRDKIEFSNYDMVIMGPGPGNPTDQNDEKMKLMRGMIETLLNNRQFFFAECLSHQILCDILGLPIVKKQTTFQGTQEEITLFDKQYLVGFYNSFVAIYDHEYMGENRANALGNPPTPQEYMGGNRANALGNPPTPQEYMGGNRANALGNPPTPQEYMGGNRPNALGNPPTPHEYMGGNRPNTTALGNPPMPQEYMGENRANALGNPPTPQEYMGGNRPNTTALGNPYHHILADLSISCDANTKEINALKGEHFFSCQFHPESILTPHGYHIIADALRSLLKS